MERMKRKLKGIIMLFLLATAFITASAQKESHFLSLDKAVSTALAGNKQAKVSKLEQQIAASDHKKSDAFFLPRLSASYTVLSTNNPLNVFGFKLQQQSVTAADFNPALLNNPSAQSDYSAKVDLMVPLVNVDLLYMQKALSAQKDAAQYGVTRTKDYITFEVKKAYLQLQLAYQQKKLLEEALNTATSVYNSTERFYEQGLIRKPDVLNAKMHLSEVETKLEKSKSNISNASDYISMLMGQATGTDYQVEDTSLSGSTDKTLSAERADFKAMDKAIQASDMMVRSARMSLLPRLNAFGNYQLNDSKLMGFNSNSYLVGVQLSWNIFNGTQTKHTIQSQKLTSDKLKEQFSSQVLQAQMEWNQTKRDLSDISFELRQESDIIRQASEALRIIKDRYEQGLEKTTDLLVAQTQLSEQQLNYAATIYKQNLTAAYLDFITSTTTY
ncbi:MAG: TolC family protein [Bacteroidales bacterium]|nr:TolC family protein [Bacteroidales bacterium]